MEPTEIAERARAGTQRLVEMVRTAHGVELGIDAPSLGWLDNHIAAERETWKRQLAPAQLANLKDMIGCYFGECLVHMLRGSWTWIGDQPAVQIEDLAKGTDVHVVYPFTRVEKHVELGDEGSIWQMYLGVGALSGRRPAEGAARTVAPPERLVAVTPSAIQRILGRLSRDKGGDVSRSEDGAWAVSIADPTRDGERLSFELAIAVEDGRVTRIECDAPVDTYSIEQATRVASYIRKISERLTSERIGFESYEGLARFVERDHEVAREPDRDRLTIDVEPPIDISGTTFDGEPWIWFGAWFGESEELDPARLLTQNGECVFLDFEDIDGDVYLSTALPLAMLTGARVLEVIEDLSAWHAIFKEGDDEDDDQ